MGEVLYRSKGVANRRVTKPNTKSIIRDPGNVMKCQECEGYNDRGNYLIKRYNAYDSPEDNITRDRD